MVMVTPTRYPSAAELEVLVTLKTYHYLTVDQVMLVTGRTSLRGTQQRLKNLADAGFVLKHDRRSSNVLQPLRAAWSLTSRSKAYLEGAEMIVLPPHRPRPYTLDHCRAINEVLIRAQRLAAEHPACVELLDSYHDRELRTWRPVLTVVPDGFLHFAVTTPAGRHSFPVLVELDMGTMDRRRWQEKVRCYLRFLAGEFQSVFHTDVATVAVIVGDTAKRLADLRRWTEHELRRADAAAHGEIFYFTLLEPDVSAAELFAAPRYQVAFRTAPDALLPVALPNAGGRPLVDNTRV
jgi:Replication-relaxation